jgi:hypothetical protein
MWYIAWAGLLTGTEGRTRAVFPTRAEAQAECDRQNEKWAGKYLHWPVPATAILGDGKE